MLARHSVGDDLEVRILGIAFVKRGELGESSFHKIFFLSVCRVVQLVERPKRVGSNPTTAIQT